MVIVSNLSNSKKETLNAYTIKEKSYPNTKDYLKLLLLKRIIVYNNGKS